MYNLDLTLYIHLHNAGDLHARITVSESDVARQHHDWNRSSNFNCYKILVAQSYPQASSAMAAMKNTDDNIAHIGTIKYTCNTENQFPMSALVKMYLMTSLIETLLICGGKLFQSLEIG